MNEREINLAVEMLAYSMFTSDQQVKNMKTHELILKLRIFFPQEVLDEAIKRIIDGGKRNDTTRI